MDSWQSVSLSMTIICLTLIWFVYALKAELKKSPITALSASFMEPATAIEPAIAIENGFELPPKKLRLLAAINKLTVDELKHQLSFHKLVQTGSKAMLLERLRQCPHIENNGADDIQVKKMFLLICWGIEVPRLAFVDKTVAAELLLQHVQVIEQIIHFGTRGLVDVIE